VTNSRSGADGEVLVGEVAAVVYTDERSGFGVVELHNLGLPVLNRRCRTGA
jgi:hypothetical protein